ncbi:MAG: alpha-amylase family glycosyl hydrolase [Treponema sp.]|nr:alpha-amylase family glycosyl hydrolase [Treponema sp.]
MSKKMGKVAGLLAGFAALFMIGCSSGGGSSIPFIPITGGNNFKTLPVGEFEEEKVNDPAFAAAAAVADDIDAENNKYILFFQATGKTDYKDRTVYLWVDKGTTSTVPMTTVTKNGITLGYHVFYDGTNRADGVPANVIEALNAGKSIKAIVKNLGESWSWQTNDCELGSSSGAKHFLITSGEGSKSENKTYIVASQINPMIDGAKALDKSSIKVTINKLYGLDTETGASGFVVKEGANIITVTDSINYETNSKAANAAKVIKLTLGQDLEMGKTYTVTNDKFGPAEGINVDLGALVKTAPAYTGDDLGATINGSTVTFKTWNPIATSIDVLLYASSSDVGNFNATSVANKTIGSTTDETLEGTVAKTVPMTKDAATNVWSVTADVEGNTYYKYKIVTDGVTRYVSDIWGKAISADAIASQIVDINKDASAIPGSRSYGTKENYYNPFTGSYENAVIYEMHVSDWTMAARDSYTTADNVGKYKEIADSTAVINHIKDLGVTHVQLLPVFEHAETDANTGYNWGYNPYHYNAPEGRYATVGYGDGTQVVCELRELIEKFHENGIAVIMDVVYNHTSGTGDGSLYDSTVPGYFYRIKDDGSYSNGSGCGNEIDTEAPMAKKYIIDSLKHWMLDYHFNGFRFDLMGVLAKETMLEIYTALYDIDPNVMVYGEPWTGGDCMVVNGANQAVSGSTGLGVGAFDDDFRDAIKGAEFGGFKRGQVQDASNDSAIITGLTGKIGPNKRNDTGKLGLALHYVECHDNYTLFDKLAISRWQDFKGKESTQTTTGDLSSEAKIGAGGLDIIKAWDKLSAAYIFLSQGTPFINGGQEFLRTKRGNENSYNTSNTSSQSTNGIRLNFAAKYSDVYNTYKGLIALRKANSEAFGANKDASAKTVSKGVTRYVTGDFLVYFNASDADAAVKTSGYSKEVDISSGIVVENAISSTSVPAKSFVIFKK